MFDHPKIGYASLIFHIQSKCYRFPVNFDINDDRQMWRLRVICGSQNAEKVSQTFANFVFQKCEMFEINLHQNLQDLEPSEYWIFLANLTHYEIINQFEDIIHGKPTIFALDMST